MIKLEYTSIGKHTHNPKFDVYYYVSIDSIEEIKTNSYEIIFDGIERGKLTSLNQRNLLNSYEEIEPFLFSIKTNNVVFETFKNSQLNKGSRGKWFLIRITKNTTELSVSIARDDYNNLEFTPDERYISSINQINNRSKVGKDLNKFFSWSSFKLSNKEEILKALSKPMEIDRMFPKYKLNVYNVGQGNLTAITDEDNMPLVYFDLGGGFAWNKFTYPNTLRLCFSSCKTVIISHWDNDHVETAKRYFGFNPAILNGITWIAPEQDITVSYFKLAAKMSVSGNLILWPKNLKGSISLWFGKLIKCKGSDKNNSGLAMIVNSPNNTIKSILNPADAAYLNIPGIKKMKFDGLVATHHGANFFNANSPIPISNIEKGNIAFSYGRYNTYNHPRNESVDAHHYSNWTNCYNTKDGNISFTTDASYLEVPCGCSSCSLNITHTF